MSHKVTVLTIDLQAGMFVSDLDRPWLETPFLMQGLLVENDEQIGILQRFCQSVTVDRSRSVGDAYEARLNEIDARRQPGSPLVFRKADDAQANDFAEICQRLSARQAARRYRDVPSLNPADQQSRLEAELLYSAPIVDDVKNTLKSIREAIGGGEAVSLREIGQHVGELARSVERNPDAMLWLSRLRSTDQYSYDHALDVSVHMMIFARFLGFPSADIEQLGLVGLMQDIGKIDIPPEILNKPGDLTKEECNLVKSHVASSIEMLLGHEEFPSHMLEVVASHHERADGSGYPRRLKSPRLGVSSEVAGLVDTYCAMTRERAYGPATSSQKVLESLILVRGEKFREPIVDQFVQCMGLYPVGSLVELNSGEVGAVIQQNQVRRLKPRLLILLAPDKSVERRPLTLDLMLDPPTPTGEPYRIVRALPADAYGINPAEFYLG